MKLLSLVELCSQGKGTKVSIFAESLSSIWWDDLDCKMHSLRTNRDKNSWNVNVPERGEKLTDCCKSERHRNRDHDTVCQTIRRSGTSCGPTCVFVLQEIMRIVNLENGAKMQYVAVCGHGPRSRCWRWSIPTDDS